MYSNRKNFLIVTASIGSGHNRAAEAIAEEIKIKYPQAKVNIIDFMSSNTAYLNGFLKVAYLKMLNFVPDMYEFLYTFTSGRMRGVSLQSLLALTMKNDMAALIEKYEADAVICTHPFPCAAAAYLKKTQYSQLLLAGVITDFAVHQLWVYKDVDLYFVANAYVKETLSGRGIPEWKIHATGIPIASLFRQHFDKPKLIEQFALQESAPIILIMGGGLGLGGVKLALTNLEKTTRCLQILVVAGENTSLWADIKKWTELSKHKIQVWGFHHHVQELMAVSTLLISKPGALTISEALAMELPMILNEPIPGQEKENAAYVENIGAAVWVKDRNAIFQIVEDVLDNNDKLLSMREQAKKYKKPEAAKDIVGCIANTLERFCNNDAVSM